MSPSSSSNNEGGDSRFQAQTRVVVEGNGGFRVPRAWDRDSDPATATATAADPLRHPQTPLPWPFGNVETKRSNLAFFPALSRVLIPSRCRHLLPDASTMYMSNR
jgi:hypothetical protein